MKLRSDTYNDKLKMINDAALYLHKNGKEARGCGYFHRVYKLA